MKIKGSHTLDAEKQMVWNMLIDSRVLALITPGVSKLERIEGDQYYAISDVKIGPIKGTFKGNFSLENKIENEKMTVRLDQKSNMGNAVADIDLTLHEIGAGTTEIKYEGKAKLSGRLASMGQRVVGGVINTLSKEFFFELENEILRTSKPEATLKKKPSWWKRIVQFLRYLFSSSNKMI